MEQKKMDRAELLRRARERTRTELTKMAVDTSAGSKGGALMALAGVVLIPGVDATGLDHLIDHATNVPVPDALLQVYNGRPHHHYRR